MSASNRDPFIWQRRIEFCDTDAAGIAHFSSFYLYMEQAEHALFRSFGYSIFPRHKPTEVEFSFPRVKCACEFFSPVEFEDTLDIEVIVTRLGAKSVSYEHRMSCRGTKVAVGTMITVCCIHTGPSNKLTSIEIPEHIRAELNKHLTA